MATPEHSYQTESKDSLQGCLMFLMAHYKKKHTLTSLISGLPLKKNHLTPQMFTRAARRAGLDSRVVERRAEDISEHTLPAVVFLKSGRFAILEAKDEDSFTLMDTFTGKREVVEGFAKFDMLYAGHLILTRPSALLEMASDSFRNQAAWFWDTVWQFWPLYTRVFVAAFFINIVALVSPLFVMNVYDRVVPNNAFETLWVLAFGALTVYVFDFLFRMIRSYFVDVAGKGADILLASRVYQQLLNIRLGQQNMSAGAFANQLKEYDTLREFFTSTTLATLVDIPFVFLFILVLGLIAGPLALIPLLLVPIILFVCYAVQMPLRGLVQQVAQDLDAKHGHLVETINGLENIKAIGSQSYVQGKWERFVGVVARLGTKQRFLAQLGINFSLLMQQLATIFVVIWGVYLISEGELSMGALVAASLLTGRTLAPLSQAVALYVRFQQARNALEGLNRLMNSKVERPEGKQFVHVPELKGDIEFRDVSFKYPGAELESLSNVNFKIEPGDKVGIIGRAGSGKSTLSRLILNLYEPTNGAVLVDGLDARQIDPAELRENICYAPQNLSLFRGTLRENLMLANPDASDDDLLQAAEMSGVIGFVRRHPLGFDMPIAERGENLSGGQRQAVGLARSILKDGSLVILDDPTSEMDFRSEEHVRSRMKRWLEGRTLVLVTHRGSMLELVDKLIVMDYSQLIACGPKDEVLKKLQTGAVRVQE